MSLLEVLVSLTLLALVVGLLGNLSREYTSIIAFSNERDASMVATNALEQVAWEVEQATEIVTATGSQLVLRKLQPDVQSRWLTMTPWTPQRVEDLQTVTYLLRDRVLVRQAEFAGVTRESSAAVGINDFSATASGEIVTLKISLEERDMVRVFSVSASRWCR